MKEATQAIGKKKLFPNKPLLEVKDITKTYGKKVVLDNINLTINWGDRIGIIGANGSGKSTLSEIIGGIRKPTKGLIKKQEALTIGLQFQDSKYPIGISVLDMIKYYLQTFNIAMKESQLNELLKTYQLIGLEHKFIETLSGGQQQRLNILLAVIYDPDLVILDEVSTGLDIEVRAEIFEFLKLNIIEKNKAMILVTHMMSEVEEFCEKYIYLHNGKILQAGLVKDIVKEYGSVHNFTWQMFEKNKKTDLEEKYSKLKKQKETKTDKWANVGKHQGKNLPLIHLLLKYYFKGFFAPFFLIAYPILILFLEGFAFKSDANALHDLVGSISMVQAMSVGIFLIPQTILEFKNSVLMKRIGTTNIRPVFFVISVIIIGFLSMVFSFLWTLLWAGIFFGATYGWYAVSAPGNAIAAIPFALIVFFSSVSLGMMLSSLFTSTTAFIALANIIFMPVAFLSGSFIPAELINNSEVLKYVTYINPFKYAMDPFLQAWRHQTTFNMNSTNIIYLVVSLGLLSLYISVSGFKMRWQK